MKYQKAIIGRQIETSRRRRAMKKWLRTRNIEYTMKDQYNEKALIKLIKKNII
jgi:hypothetical protein